MKTISIGKLAKLSGVSQVTLRYYERIGLIPMSARSSGGYRLYSFDLLTRIQFIQKAKRLGFSLRDIKQLLILHDTNNTTSMPVRINIESKLAEVQQKITDLKKIETALESLLSTCNGQLPISKCPIIQNIFQKDNE